MKKTKKLGTGANFWGVETFCFQKLCWTYNYECSTINNQRGLGSDREKSSSIFFDFQSHWVEKFIFMYTGDKIVNKEAFDKVQLISDCVEKKCTWNHRSFFNNFGFS